ncbi:MAG: phosphoribosylamine--glycine ligase family protein, partial [Spirochaetota bacterium]|nr:phosphoribosylamine--glycine ligase family protein [Spirochaetota bacterium]
MRVLVLGSGAKDHAIAWWFSQSRLISALYVAPGNAGTESIAK